MKARWTMVATLFAVAAATLALAGAAFAQSQRQTEKAFPGEVTHIDDTYVDPFFSDLCGFTVVQHDVGVNKVSVFVTGPNDQLRIRDQISLRQTVTNPETGTSLTVQTSGSETLSIVLPDDHGSFVTEETFMGLNFLIKGLKGQDGTSLPPSSGRGVVFFSLTVDENGNVVDFNFGERRTPHLEHIIGSDLNALVCETLAQ
jgi:hypothetical protein